MSAPSAPAPISMTRRERMERAQALLREPEFMEILCDNVCDGETLYNIAQKHGIPYRILYVYVQGDDDRAAAYETALEARAANISDRVISGILGVSQVNIKDIFKDDGDLKPLSEIPDDVMNAVSGIDITIDDQGKKTKKVRLHDKMRSYEMMGRNQKLFTDKIEHTGIVKLEDLVNASMTEGK